MKILMLTALIVCGWSFASDSFDVFTQYQERVACERVKSGDTLDAIAERYYIKDERRNKSWDEFRCRVMSVNSQLTANGRMLQPNDNVYVIYEVKN